MDETAQSFFERGRDVLIGCTSCGHQRTMSPEMVVHMLGETFPLSSAGLALSAQLYCEACGARRPDVFLRWREEPAFTLPRALLLARVG